MPKGQQQKIMPKGQEQKIMPEGQDQQFMPKGPEQKIKRSARRQEATKLQQKPKAKAIFLAFSVAKLQAADTSLVVMAGQQWQNC